MVLFSSPIVAEHTPPPGHPEQPERAQVFDAAATAFRAQGGRVEDLRPATEAEVLRIHRPSHVARVRAAAGRAVMFDPDTFTSPESSAVAFLAAGAAIEAATWTALHGEPTFALVRPPGHHAEPDRAMGFCLLNNVAIAAASLRASGLSRVAVVDIDVHHGNGTQAAFYTDPTVLYASSHQFPFYPGTGAADEIGEAAGEGYTVNVPLAAGATDTDVLRAYDETIVPALERFHPEAILISAGFDAHARDPLGGLRMTTEGYGRLVGRLDEVARRLSGRRIALVTEGGYHLGALAECLALTMSVLR